MIEFQVAFGVYSGEDCRKRWHYVQAHLRRYRLLNEMVVDAMSWRLRPWTNFNASRKVLSRFAAFLRKIRTKSRMTPPPPGESAQFLNQALGFFFFFFYIISML